MRECSVYRFYDSADRLLYVGLSVNPRIRIYQHKGTPWQRESAWIRIDKFPSRDEASSEETRAIREENPRYNSTHNGKVPQGLSLSDRMKGYLTLDELAAFLGVKSTGSLRSQIRRGVLTAERIGQRTWVVSEEEAKKYRDAHRAGEGKPGRRAKVEEGAE